MISEHLIPPRSAFGPAPAVLVALLVYPCLCPIPHAEGAGTGAASVRIAEALDLVHLSRADLALPIDYEEADEWRLPMVDRVMSDPISVGETCEALASDVTADSTVGGFARTLEVMGKVLDERSQQRPPAAQGSTAAAVMPPPPDALLGLVNSLALGLHQAGRLTGRGLRQVTPAGRDSLLRYGPRVIEEDVSDPSKTIFQLEEEKLEELALSRHVLALAATIDTGEMVRAGVVAAQGLEEAYAAAARIDPAGIAPLAAGDVTGVDGDVLYAGTRADGARIVIGGAGPNTYREAFEVIVDLGGDDTYLAGAGGSSRGRFPVSMALDLNGNDLYSSTEPAGIAGGYLGVGLLVDVAGNDVYRAGNFALGTGWYGAGGLLDLSGDDRYIGDTAVEGAAHAGVGLLRDLAGSDSYEAAFASQAFGFVGGVGVLDDRGGADFYLIRPRYVDLIRYDDHFVSLSQGFAYGHRPEKSGGVGVLIEGGGNDLYLSDIFGQGAAYWYALGCLVDRGGNDTYVSHQYAQGAGIHLAAAALVDEGGEDRYFARGVSQGCGHDLGVGLLWEKDGSDTYTAYDLSQGAGNANGIGILADESGDDGYWVKRADNTHGYGNPRREYGSSGLLLDYAGRDHYAGRGADSTAWMGPWFGAGMDLAPPDTVAGILADAAPASTPPPASAAGIEDSVFQPSSPPDGGPHTCETLFILASSLEPRSEADRSWARAEIGRRGAECIPTMIAMLGTTDAPDRQALMDLLKQIGEPAVDPLIAALASRDWRVVLLASRILGDLAPPRAVDPLTRAAKHSRWVVRESAVTALGKIGEPHSLPALRETLAKDRSPQVRKSAAFALGEIGGEGVVTPLVTALADERGIVRETARTSLASLDSLAVPALCQVINAGTAGVGSRPPRAVALSLEALRGMGRGLPAAELHALTGSYLWREAEIRMATARVIAATRQATTHQPLTVADHEASLQVFADLLRDPDARVRALAEGLRAEASPGLAAGIE